MTPYGSAAAMGPLAGIPPERLPRHVAIIMDGNGRWAEQRGLERTKGHEAGERALFDVVEGALEVGLRYLSVYAFSTENWSRPEDEVEFLLGFNRVLLRQRRDDMHERGVRIRRIGRRDRVPDDVLAEFDAAEEMTAHNARLDLLVCFNYGSRAELEDAAHALSAAFRPPRAEAPGPPRPEAPGPPRPEAPGPPQADLASYLYAPDVPDVDLLIRTSGEKRLSNFLLWQCAYAELYFTDLLWPDFDRRALFDALRDYASRSRRFGGLT